MKKYIYVVIFLLLWAAPFWAVEPADQPFSNKSGGANQGSTILSAAQHEPKSFPELSGFLLRQSLEDWRLWRETKDSLLLRRALLNVDSSLSIDAGESEAWFLQGMLYSELKGDRLAQERALASFLRCIEINPGHGRGQFMTAMKLQELGRFDLAAAQYRFIMDKDAAMVNGLNITNLALSYLGAGEGAAGISCFRDMIKRYPGNADLRTALAVLLKAEGRPEDARDELIFVITNVSATEAKRDNARKLLLQWKSEVKQ
jgi:tetratricopeptide (TPR) repeat protein